MIIIRDLISPILLLLLRCSHHLHPIEFKHSRSSIQFVREFLRKRFSILILVPKCVICASAINSFIILSSSRLYNKLSAASTPIQNWNIYAQGILHWIQSHQAFCELDKLGCVKNFDHSFFLVSCEECALPLVETFLLSFVKMYFFCFLNKVLELLRSFSRMAYNHPRQNQWFNNNMVMCLREMII